MFNISNSHSNLGAANSQQFMAGYRQLLDFASHVGLSLGWFIRHTVFKNSVYCRLCSLQLTTISFMEAESNQPIRPRSCRQYVDTCLRVL